MNRRLVAALNRIVADESSIDFDYAEVVMDWVRGNDIDQESLKQSDNRNTTEDSLYRKVRLRKDDFQKLLDGKRLVCRKDYDSWSHDIKYDLEVGTSGKNVVVTFKKKIPEAHQILDVFGYFEAVIAQLKSQLKEAKNNQANDLLIKMRNMYDDLVEDEKEVITRCQVLTKQDIYTVQYNDKEKPQRLSAAKNPA